MPDATISSQRRSYSASPPSAQWMRAGCVSVATSATHSASTQWRRLLGALTVSRVYAVMCVSPNQSERLYAGRSSRVQLAFVLVGGLARALGSPRLARALLDVGADQSAHHLGRRLVLIGAERLEQRLLARIDENRQTRGAVFGQRLRPLLDSNQMLMLLSSKHNLPVAVTGPSRDLR